ncbi:hypothetical protein MHSWG343_00200 [Candidatus Mycoplasma haematohominis]|uniref:Uncharacterized protein n=1 Tax=Candidatus Mycoplasma haematohominis TaxID=1494318 RepID=A0A478FPB6_9MOLU|nr:hypothetical protein MHSWG343_00200 [Candidatus Mycoplasma haemohominis]
MASPVAVGAGVVGGTAAVGATSFAAYQAFKKDGSTEEVKNPTLRDGQADNPGTSNTGNTAGQADQSTGQGGAQDTSGKGSTGEAGSSTTSPQSTDQASGSSTGGTTTPGTGTPAAAAAAA